MAFTTKLRQRALDRKIGRKLRRKVRAKGIKRVETPKQRERRERLSGLGRSAAEKRVARAGWLDLINADILANLEIAIDNISTGRTRPKLPGIVPAKTDESASQDLADAIMDWLPGKKEQLEKTLDTTKGDIQEKFGDRDWTGTSDKKEVSASAPKTKTSGGGFGPAMLLFLLPFIL